MNHCMFGHIQEWFQNSILGIRQAPDSVGFKRLKLRPEPVGDLTSASGYYDSIRGRIESRWRIENGHFYWHVTVPANAGAEVHVPAGSAETSTSPRQSDTPSAASGVPGTDPPGPLTATETATTGEDVS